MEISSVACEFSSIKIDYSDYPKSLISRINEGFFFIRISKTHKLHLSHLFCCHHTCYCVNMVSVTSESRYHPGYQSRSSVYICGLIPLNFVELAEAVPIAFNALKCSCS